MARTSRLAWLQQALVACTISLAAAWWVAHWSESPAVAVAGALGILFAYAILLGIQCGLLRYQARNDPSLRPGAGELARAWLAESMQFPKVFFWRQPFRWREVADNLGPGTEGRRGFVFVHGFMCNRGFWTPWLREVRRRGHAFVAVNLEPVMGPIDAYSEIIDQAVDAVTRATGLPPIIVCHSMGGLAARAWLRRANDASRVLRVVTIASPHHGTFLARFSHTPNGLQMRLGGEWLEQLAAHELTHKLPPATCWYSHCDNIVFPVGSATLPWADNRLVRGPAHVQLAFRQEVMVATLDMAS